MRFKFNAVSTILIITLVYLVVKIVTPIDSWTDFLWILGGLILFTSMYSSQLTWGKRQWGNKRDGQ